jgi:HD domain
MTASEQPELRLAELVAALSLGIDLGFGQPMEHVLRQCLIALRLAECAGLDDDLRAAVYYTALLVNVGCHTDAHEQAKWFGDDIALKADKYAYEQRSLQAAVAGMRRLGSGNPPLHRIRTGLEFALGGFRDLDGMIAQHAKLARMLGEQLGLPLAALDGLAGSYERWDGKGWPGELEGEDIPITARIAQLAEFVEVAHRTGGVDAAASLATRGAGTQFDPDLCVLLCAHDDSVLGGLDSMNTWNAVIDAEPALAMRMSPDQFDAALDAVATFVDLKSPYMLGHARAVSELARDAGVKLGLAGDDLTALRRAGRARSRAVGRIQFHLGQARTARGRRVGTRANAAVSHGTHAASVDCADAAQSDRGAAA